MGLNKNGKGSGLSVNSGTGSSSSKLVYVNILDNKLYLTKDRCQTTDMINSTEIILPTVNRYTEINLFFKANEDLVLILPEGKYKVVPKLSAHKFYKFTFIYVMNHWIIDFVEYKDIDGANYYEEYMDYPIEINDENISEEYLSYLIEIHGNTVNDNYLGELENGQYLTRLNVSDDTVELGKGGRIE